MKAWRNYKSDSASTCAKWRWEKPWGEANPLKRNFNQQRKPQKQQMSCFATTFGFWTRIDTVVAQNMPKPCSQAVLKPKNTEVLEWGFLQSSVGHQKCWNWVWNQQKNISRGDITFQTSKMWSVPFPTGREHGSWTKFLNSNMFVSGTLETVKSSSGSVLKWPAIFWVTLTSSGFYFFPVRVSKKWRRPHCCHTQMAATVTHLGIPQAAAR